jgi:hypothetical protein
MLSTIVNMTVGNNSANYVCLRTINTCLKNRDALITTIGTKVLYTAHNCVSDYDNIIYSALENCVVKAELLTVSWTPGNSFGIYI